MSERLWVKVCGLTSPEQACMVRDAGADAIGINLWPRSPRSVDLAMACKVAAAVRGTIQIVAVTVDLSLSELSEINRVLQPDWLQLHGAEPDTHLEAFAPRAYRAVGLADAADVQRALQVPGPWVMVDARDDVAKGGTGRAPPASLAKAVCAARPTVLAGGLGADNVAAAVAAFGPAGVDAASGLEDAPGHKNAEQVLAFVRAARAGSV